MEAILGIQHSNRFYNLIYRHPLLLAVTGDCSTLGILVTHTMVLVTHTMEHIYIILGDTVTHINVLLNKVAKLYTTLLILVDVLEQSIQRH